MPFCRGFFFSFGLPFLYMHFCNVSLCIANKAVNINRYCINLRSEKKLKYGRKAQNEKNSFALK